MPDTCFLQYIQQNKIYMVTAVTYLIGVYLTGLMRLEEAPTSLSEQERGAISGAGVDREVLPHCLWDTRDVGLLGKPRSGTQCTYCLVGFKQMSPEKTEQLIEGEGWQL